MGCMKVKRKNLFPIFTALASLSLMLVLTATTSAAENVSWTGCGITKKAFMTEILAFE